MAFIDIHHHLLFGVDDGPRDWEETRLSLHHAADGGIGAIVATPHADVSRRPFNMESCRDQIHQIEQYCADERLPLRVTLGAELFCREPLTVDSIVKRLDSGDAPTLAATRFVLLEFPIDMAFDKMVRIAERFLSGGYWPILAHIERYACLVQKPGNIGQLREFRDLRLQVNCNTLIAPFGFTMRRFIKRAVESGWIDYAATDAHDRVYRPVRMKECHETLSRRYGAEVADALCGGNQMEVVGD